MRWISQKEIELSITEEWQERHKKAIEELLSKNSSKERKEVIIKYSDLWRDFYKNLPERLKTKCWYCETKSIRTDTPVDHFRPKNGVFEEEDHEGYWWLAFEWNNYRCACTYCNSKRVLECGEGGKECKFPLVDSTKRVYNHTETDKIEFEEPNFLDPMDPDDHKLLWFDDYGKPMVNPRWRNANDIVEKVKNSIDIYHLDETRINRKRKTIKIDVYKLVSNLRKKVDVMASKNKLREMIDEQEEYSKSTIVYLREHRGFDPVDDILNLD